jgi:deoxyribodipyrimidine photo-lyase
MFEPRSVRTGAGGPYKVFTPFWRACLEDGEPSLPADAPDMLPVPAMDTCGGPPESDALDGRGLLPRTPDWSAGLAETWTPGEGGAHSCLQDFLDRPVEEYGTGRRRHLQVRTGLA